MWSTPWIPVTILLSALASFIHPGKAYPRSNVLWFEVGPTIRNCHDVQKHNDSSLSGTYTVYPYDCCPDRPLQVYCDMDTDGGGWTVIQRRDSASQPREDFLRTWMEYALGFGNLEGEFWLGLDHIHALTDQKLNQLRFDLRDFEDDFKNANYKFFYVHDRGQNYKMEVNGFSGDAGDSFSELSGQGFSSQDKDLDMDVGKSCAKAYKGSWWYKQCHKSNLNGFYYTGEHSSFADGINWFTWRGYNYSLKKTEIKIRPAF